MNPKTSKYILFGGVLLIWGLIIYRVVKGLGSGTDIPVGTRKVQPLKYTAEKDSFILYANYEDPFLKDLGMASDTIEKKVPESAIQPAQLPGNNDIRTKPPLTTLPKIEYIGMIANPEKNIRMALIRIEGKEYIAKLHEVVKGLKMIVINNQKVVILVNGKKITVNR